MAGVSRLQLVFLSMAWLAGIYVNGFVAIVPGTDAAAILLNPAVESHVVFATLGAATSVFLVALAWAGGSKRTTAATLAAAICVVLAGDSGLAFVLGGGTDSAQSMIMGSAFVTAVFFTFLSMAGADSGGGLRAYGRETSKAARFSCYLALLLFYCVFVTGVYVNLFVAGPALSLPPALAQSAFRQAESTSPFLIHEALGGALLATLVVFCLSMLAKGASRSSLASVAPALLVAYSAYVGSLNLTSPAAQALSSGGAASVLVPMLSSAGLMAATVITMLLALGLRPERSGI